jgi:hypothetical protein
MWSVRRRPTPPPPAAKASLLQFQDHVNALMRSSLSDTALRQLRATDYFRFLPAAGILPLGEAGARGMSIDSFFADQPHRPRQASDRQYMDGLKVRTVLNDAIFHEPIDLPSNPGQMVWVYRVWQNEQSASEGSGARQRYAVFTSPHMPPQNVARFDVARWDYSNFASCECDS